MSGSGCDAADVAPDSGAYISCIFARKCSSRAILERQHFLSVAKVSRLESRRVNAELLENDFQIVFKALLLTVSASHILIPSVSSPYSFC